jgi:hypothetical protein
MTAIIGDKENKAKESRQEDNLDDKEIDILTFTLAKGRVHFKDYVSEFEDGRGWTHDSLMKRIGSEGTLQERSWLMKGFFEDRKWQVYYVPSEKTLQVRLLALALSRKTDLPSVKKRGATLEELEEVIPELENMGWDRKYVLGLLRRLNARLYCQNGKVKIDWKALIQLVKPIVEASGGLETSFTMILNYSPTTPIGSLPMPPTQYLIGNFIVDSILKNLTKQDESS